MHVDQNKILGCTVGAAADAMGAATEVRTQQQIKDYFGGWVTTFQNRLRTRLAAAMKRGCARMILFRLSTLWTRCCAINAGQRRGDARGFSAVAGLSFLRQLYRSDDACGNESDI